MTAISQIDPGVDPRHVFLDARDVMTRYGWGKTKGYQNLKDRDLVPPPVMTESTARTYAGSCGPSYTHLVPPPAGDTVAISAWSRRVTGISTPTAITDPGTA